MLLHPREEVGNQDGFEARFATPITPGAEEAQRVGRFRFCVDGQRWEWSENVERMHGYEPGTVTPTTDLVLGHTHPDDWQRFTALLDKVVDGEPFSSRHRIIDAAGRTHWVVVVGDRMLDVAGAVIGTSGFYVDITDTVESDISCALSKVTEARAEIEQAKGLIMAAYGIGADRAFDILVWRSQETNVKVRKTRPPIHQRHGRRSASRYAQTSRPCPARHLITEMSATDHASAVTPLASTVVKREESPWPIPSRAVTTRRRVASSPRPPKPSRRHPRGRAATRTSSHRSTPSAHQAVRLTAPQVSRSWLGSTGQR